MSSWFGLFSVFNWTEGIPYHSYLWQMFSCFSRIHAYSFTPGSSYQQLKSLFVNNTLRRIYIVRALLTGGCLKKPKKHAIVILGEKAASHRLAERPNMAVYASVGLEI